MPLHDSASTAASRQTILVVDDDPAVLAMTAAMLEQAKFHVLRATGSSEALKLCKTHSVPIHLLLTDLVMPPPEFTLASSGNEFPHVHGHDLAVRALQIRNDLRIVLMSGNMDKDLTAYGIQRGTLPFLQKPFELQALVDLVSQTLHAPPPSVESLTATSKGGPKDGDEWFD